MKQKQRSVLGYTALVLALAVIVGSVTALVQMNGRASAEIVTVAEKATVVESPFTQAVRNVRDSVVGVNNYGKVTSSGFPYGFGFGGGFGGGYGYGFGGGDTPDESEKDREVLQGAGSGVVIAQGYVLTNYHVVEDATSLEITVGDQTLEATLVGHDETLDIAILKVNQLNVQPVVIGDSDVLNVGDWAICIGNPLSFTGTTTVGVISALNREVTSSNTDIYGRRTQIVNAMIQTDAAINAGNSGGGMFNVAGELVGIPSLKYTGSYYSSTTVEGIGMAIPINAAKPLISSVIGGQTADSAATQPEATIGSSPNEAIISSGKPRIGVTVTNMNSSSPAVSQGILPMGAYIMEIESGSPADIAGLKAEDIVVDVDGNVITSTTQMINILQAKEAGDTVAIKVYRVEGLSSYQNYQDIPDGQYMDFTIELKVLDDVKQ